MATYAPVYLGNSNWVDVPSVGVDRTAQALGGDVWISDDASPNVDRAQRIMHGERFFIASGKTYKVRRVAAVAQLRLMDY